MYEILKGDEIMKERKLGREGWREKGGRKDGRKEGEKRRRERGSKGGRIV